MIDRIPLSEIDRVHVFDEEIDRRTYENSLMISTIPEGFNSGRTYYLQESSYARCLEFVKQLNHLAKSARARAESRSAFAKSQLKVRKIYKSWPFQMASASLLITVRC